MTGTARYASIFTHKGIEQSRRDDLECIIYVLLYLKKGSLPWQGMPGRSKNERYENIKRKKMETGLEELCKGCPNDFRELIETVRGLKFDQEPDYSSYYKILGRIADNNKFKLDDNAYIWKHTRLKQDKKDLKESMAALMAKKEEDKVSKHIAIADIRRL